MSQSVRNIFRDYWKILFHIIAKTYGYNSFLVYCRELASGTVSLTGGGAQGDDSKHDSHYKMFSLYELFELKFGGKTSEEKYAASLGTKATHIFFKYMRLL